MAMEIKQHLKLSQQLVMTPQLQQAIKLLQLSRVELLDTLREELLENPVLEDSVDSAAEQAKTTDFDESTREGDAERVGETELPVLAPAADKLDSAPELKPESRSDEAVKDFDWEGYLENQAASPPMPTVRRDGDELPSVDATLTKGTSLFEHLRWQIELSNVMPEERGVAMLIIGNITPDGYLDQPLEEIAEEAGCSLEFAEDVLELIQELDPPGVAARNLQECLLLQAKHIGADDPVLVGIITKHLHNLEKRSYPAIAKDLNQPLEEIYEAIKVIARFDPKPGRNFTDEEPTYVSPDVYIHKMGDKFFVVPNDDGLPKLKISDYYRVALAGGKDGKDSKGGKDTKDYIQERLRSAQWLIRSIQQRQRTIVRVTESILRFQREFFDKGPAYLKPLILRDVADDIGMHESTVSRVTTNKYVHTPQGILELKYFFNSGITRSDGDDLASEAVKLKIRRLIGSEDSKNPHSDQHLVELLAEQGIEIARRTVAKYREQLKILSSSKRREMF